MTALTPERRAELRARFYTPPSATAWMSIREDELDALLDAADERDRLAARFAEVELAARHVTGRWNQLDDGQGPLIHAVQRLAIALGDDPKAWRSPWNRPPADLAAWRALLAEAEAAGEWVVARPAGRDYGEVVGADELDRYGARGFDLCTRIPAPPPEDRP